MKQPRWRSATYQMIFDLVRNNPGVTREQIEDHVHLQGVLGKTLAKMRPYLWERGMDIICFERRNDRGAKYKLVDVT